MFGAIFSKKDFRDYQLINKYFYFPQSFQLKDWDKMKIKNQGSVGSCVAHALSTVIEYYNHIQIQDDFEISTGYIYGNRILSLYKDSGMITRDALATIKNYGSVYHIHFPYNVEVPKAIDEFQNNFEKLYDEGYLNRISGYCRLRSENEIKEVLMQGKPVVVAIEWYNDMKVKDGILTTSYQGSAGGHCMVIYGWTEEGWLTQNSWGQWWGRRGTCIIPYNMKLRETWGVIDTIEGTTLDIKKPFSSKIGKIFALLLNKVYQLFDK